MAEQKIELISIPVTIDTKDLVDELAGSNDMDALYELIVAIDDSVGDWDFTKKLHKYFKKEVKGAV